VRALDCISAILFRYIGQWPCELQYMHNLRIDEHSTPITEYMFTVMSHLWLCATEVFKPIFPCTYVIRTNKMYTFYNNVLI